PPSIIDGGYRRHSSGSKRQPPRRTMQTNDRPLISGRVVAAARALVGVSRADFAAAAGLSVDVMRRIESAGSAWVQPAHKVEAVERALRHFGVIVIPESDGMGAGVRLKFTR